MWIHEGWTTYLESLYVEYRYGHADAIKYLNGVQAEGEERSADLISTTGRDDSRHESATDEDQYFKGALMINTLRSVVNDDPEWFTLIHDFYQHFKYQNIMTEDVVAYFNQQTGMDLTPFFNQYLRHTAIPTLELKFDEPGTVQLSLEGR